MTVDHVGACQRKWSYIIMRRLRAKEGASNGAQPSRQGNKSGRKEQPSEPCNLWLGNVPVARPETVFFTKLPRPTPELTVWVD